MMIVIEDYDHLLLDPFENLIQEHICGALWLLRQLLWLLQVSKNRFAKIRDSLLNAVREITQEHRRIGVSVIKLIPDMGPFLLSQKIRHQRCLSRACIGGDQRYGQREIRLQPFDKAGPRQNLRRWP